MLIRDESGQTLIELMVATVIGLIVIFAAFLLLDSALSQNTRISQREDASQRGRLAMEELTREIRSQLCISTTDASGTVINNPAISAGTGTSITFYDDLTGNARPPMRRTITFTPGAVVGGVTKGGTITEYQYQGVAYPPNTTFPITPTRSFVLLQNVVPNGSTPIFQYFPFLPGAGNGISSAPIAVPLTTASSQTAVDVRISMLVRGTNSNFNANGSTFVNDVYTRVADPTTPALGTNCS